MAGFARAMSGRSLSGDAALGGDFAQTIDAEHMQAEAVQASGDSLVGTAAGTPEARRGSSSSFRSLSGSGRPQSFPTSPEAYQLIAELGLGVTATVYLALCRPLGRKVAVKLLDLEAIEAAGGLDVVIKETAVMAGMRHPNILPLLAAFVEGGRLWMVLPFYSAGSLLSVIQYRHPEGIQDWHAVATVMREVAKGLAYMHASGRIHRDLKAANILVAPDGSVALADFGVSAALEAHPDEEGASQSQHAPGAARDQPGGSFDGAAMLRRVSIQQQAASAGSKDAAAHRAAAEIERSGSKGRSGRMTAAEYRAARRAGQMTPTAAPSLLTQSLSTKERNRMASPTSPGALSDAGDSSRGSNASRRIFSNAASAAQYLGRSTFVGTPCWMAPEVMAPQVEGYGQAADIWSMGITMLEVATGRAPTARRSVNEILISVLSSPEDDPTSIAGELSHTPEAFQEVVYSCLAKNPSERPTAAQLLQMRFFKTMAMDPSTLARSLLEGVPLVTQRDESNPPPLPQGSATPERSARTASGRFSQGGSKTAVGGKSGGGGIAEALETAVALLRQVARSALPPGAAKHQLTADELRAARGFGFEIVKRGRYLRAAARGHGFVVARLPSDDDSVVTWSAPAWYSSRVSASGFTTGNDEVACVYLLQRDEDLETFTTKGLASIRADAGRKNRHYRSCRSLCTGALTTLSLSKGGTVSSDSEGNEALYGEGAEPAAILGGRVRPPAQFQALYDELAAVLQGEALTVPEGLDTPDAARSVSASLGERISGARFEQPRPGGRRATASVGAVTEGPRRAASGDIDSGREDDGDAPRPLRPRAVSLQDDDLNSALEALSMPSAAGPSGVQGAPKDGSAPALGRPSLGRLSTSSSAPDLTKLSGSVGTGSDGGDRVAPGPEAADPEDVLQGAATTDDIHPGSSADGFGAPAPLPRVNIAKPAAAAARPGPADDTAMSWSPDSLPSSSAFAQQPASAGGDAHAGGSGGGGQPPAADGRGSDSGRQPAAGPCAEERFPTSPVSSAGGGRMRGTPSGLEPVLEDFTLVAADRPRMSSSAGTPAGTPDASIFDIGALEEPSAADAAHQAAMLEADDSDSTSASGRDSQTGGPSPYPGASHAAALPRLRSPAPAGAGSAGDPANPRTPGGGPALRRLPPNPTSASAQPRAHSGHTPPASSAGAGRKGGEEDPFEWSFEREDATFSTASRRRLSNISLPRRETLSKDDLSDAAQSIVTPRVAAPDAQTQTATQKKGIGKAAMKFLENSTWSHNWTAF